MHLMRKSDLKIEMEWSCRGELAIRLWHNGIVPIQVHAKSNSFPGLGPPDRSVNETARAANGMPAEIFSIPVNGATFPCFVRAVSAQPRLNARWRSLNYSSYLLNLLSHALLWSTSCPFGCHGGRISLKAKEHQNSNIWNLYYSIKTLCKLIKTWYPRSLKAKFL
jgi:hypothetical protein